MIAIADIAEAVSLVLPEYDVRAVYLFGSFARGDTLEGSDVDVRIECGPQVGYGDLLDIQERLEGMLKRKVEVVTNPIEHMRPAFRKRILQDQVLVYAAA